jgi:hypothetical protein
VSKLVCFTGKSFSPSNAKSEPPHTHSGI